MDSNVSGTFSGSGKNPDWLPAHMAIFAAVILVAAAAAYFCMKGRET